MMGDMNAKVGNDKTSYERAMMEAMCGSMNNNWEIMQEWCQCTIFPSEGHLRHTQTFTGLPGVRLLANIRTRWNTHGQRDMEKNHARRKSKKS